MTFPKPIDFKARWNYHSAVSECRECEGHGAIREYSGTYGTSSCQGFDDYPCRECEETGVLDCTVCGSDVRVSGYDCITCGIVDELDPSQLTNEVAADLHKGILAAMAARREHAEKAA